VKIEPEYWDAYYHLGNVYYKNGERESAKSIFETLLEKNPQYEKRDEILKLIE
jgi:TolA-binding protein